MFTCLEVISRFSVSEQIILSKTMSTLLSIKLSSAVCSAIRGVKRGSKETSPISPGSSGALEVLDSRM